MKEPVDEIDDDETVFPCVETVMSFVSMYVFCSEQVKQPIYSLRVRDTVMIFSSPFPATVVFDWCFSFLIK